MKRKATMAGLTVLLMLVLLAALAGPAGAKQAEKWKEFTAKFSMSEYLPGTEWFPGGTELADGTIVPKQVWQTRDEYFAGQYTAWDKDGNEIEELSGYLVVSSDWRGRVDRDGNAIFSYVNKSTLYVGANSAGDVGQGIWEMSAVGETVYRFDPDTGVLLGITDHIEGVGHGVSDEVKGWVLKFTGAFDETTKAYYVAK
jgi:hypothetical protein